MCRKISFLLLLSTLFLIIVTPAYAISAKSAILIEKESGDIIFEKNSSDKMPIASTTKIMTAIVAIEAGQLDEIFKIPKEATGIEGSSIYLKEGEVLTRRELLYALLLESANDASVALAYSTYGGISPFVDKMNEKAAELGLTSTHFTNPHGLYDKEHYSSSRDLSILTKYALDNPVFREIVATKSYSIPSETHDRLLVNHNKLLRLYHGANGVKTGFTRLSGRCLVSSAERDGVSLICVTLDAPNDWNDHTELLDLGFSLYENVSLAKYGDYLVEIPLNNCEKTSILAINEDSFSVTRKKGKGDFYAKIEYDENLSAPIKKGDPVGRILFYDGNETVGEIKLISLEDVKNNKSALNKFIERLFKNGKN